MSKLVAFFRTGTFRDNEGREHTITRQDLDAIAANYNPEFHEAPEVIGHPKLDMPAFGWVKSVKREGDILFYEPKDRVSEFQEMIDKRMFKKRSAAFYPGWKLKHIGWLGATPPAVKGLPDVSFTEEGEAITFEFSEASAINSIGYIFQRLRDWMISKFGQDTADQIVNSYEIDNLKNVVPDDAVPEAAAFAEGDAAKKAQESRVKKYGIGIKSDGNVTKPADYKDIADADFADPVNYRYPIDAGHCQAALSYWGTPKNREGYTDAEVKVITKRMLGAAKKHGIEVDPEKWNFSEEDENSMGDVEKLKEQITEKDRQISEFAEKDKTKDARIKTLEAEARKKEFVSFCEGLTKEGKLPPAVVPACLDFMEILSSVETFEFAESDGKKTAKKPVDVFKDMLSGLGKVIEFGEHATKEKAGVGLDMTDPQAIANAALEFQEAEAKAGRTINIAQAVNHVTNKGGK